MNYVADGCLVEAMRRLDGAIQALENYSDNGPPQLVGEAYRELLNVRGQLIAMRQMQELELEVKLATLAAERAPALRLVK